MKQRLVLFDIDGTLLDTGGAGGGALLDAAETTFQVPRDSLQPLDLAGATDGSVIRKLFADARHEFEEAKARTFWEIYLDRLHHRLHASLTGRLNPGVTELLAALAGDPRFGMGLLTGNIRRGAMIKLEHFDIAAYFVDGGFGDDSVNRDELGPFAIRRMEAALQRRFASDEIIIIGDTPKDIACAAAISARCLAVGTGLFSHEALQPFNAWQVRNSLADTTEILQLLMS